MTAGASVSEAAVSVSAWATRAAPSLSGKSGHPKGHPALSVMTGGENSRLSRRKMTWGATWQRIREALVISTMFWITLVVILGAVPPPPPPLDGGVWRCPLIQKFQRGSQTYRFGRSSCKNRLGILHISRLYGVWSTGEL